MKARRMLLLVAIGATGACADPPRPPPVTYVKIERGPEASPPPPATTKAASSSPSSEKDPGPAPATPTSSRSEAPPTSLTQTTYEPKELLELCFKKLGGGCCGDVGTKVKTQGTKTSCPAGTLLGARCRGIGPKCRPRAGD